MAEGGADVVRELLVRLGVIADTAEAKKFDLSLKGIAYTMGGLTGIATAVKGAIIGVVTATALAGDRASKTSQRIGVEVEALQELEYAAGLSGVATADLAVALKFLNVNMDKAASGEKAQAAAFKSLGVSVKNADGTMRGADAVLTDLSGKFAKMPDGAKKTAKAVEIFGRSGAAMIPLLNSGAEGIAQMRQEAIELGIVMDKETTKASEAFNDELERLHKSVTGVGIAVAKRLLAPLTQVTERIRRWVVANRELLAQRIERTFTVLGEAITFVGDKLEWLWGRVMRITDALGGIDNTLKLIGVAFAAAFTVNTAVVIAKIVQSLGSLKLVLNPIKAATLAVFALFLILEDLYVFTQGGESEFEGLWKVFVPFALKVGDAFSYMADQIERVANGIDRLIRRMTELAGLKLPPSMQAIVDKLEGKEPPKRNSGSMTDAGGPLGKAFPDTIKDDIRKSGKSKVPLEIVVTPMALGLSGMTGRSGTEININSNPVINVTVGGGVGTGAGAAGQVADVKRHAENAVREINATTFRQASDNFAGAH